MAREKSAGTKLEKLGAAAGDFAMWHPTAAGALGLGGGALAGAGAGAAANIGASKLDEMLPGVEMMGGDKERAHDLGINPDDYEEGHMHPFVGAATGAGYGALANTLLKKKSLGKYLAIGALAGGGLGGLTTTYKKKEKK